jgi:hypothetical protein
LICGSSVIQHKKKGLDEKPHPQIQRWATENEMVFFSAFQLCCDPTPTNAPVVDEAVLAVLG